MQTTTTVLVITPAALNKVAAFLKHIHIGVQERAQAGTFVCVMLVFMGKHINVKILIAEMIAVSASFVYNQPALHIPIIPLHTRIIPGTEQSPVHLEIADRRFEIAVMNTASPGGIHCNQITRPT